MTKKDVLPISVLIWFPVAVVALSVPIDLLLPPIDPRVSPFVRFGLYLMIPASILVVGMGCLKLLVCIKKRHAAVPAIGDKWPGTEAIYAGKSPSRDGSKIVDLIYWRGDNQVRSYADNIAYCESVSPETGSHAATRQQAIVINDNLRHLLNDDHWYWTETKTNLRGEANSDKTNSGEYDAFVQEFSRGTQNFYYIFNGCLPLVVSEIHTAPAGGAA